MKGSRSVARPIVLSLGCILAVLVGLVQGNVMRGNTPEAALQRMSTQQLRERMLDELVAALGNGNRVTEERLGRIEAVLRPMVLAMPKNAQGNLEDSAVRYVLHRLFVQRHAMYIKGLEPGGGAWNETSPTSVLEERVPAYLLELFEQRLQGQGLGVHELAILAATLEHIIHDEAVDKLKAVYRAEDIELDQRLDAQTARDVVDTYMMVFLLGKNSTVLTTKMVNRMKSRIHKAYPGWPASQKFAGEVMQRVVDTMKEDPDFSDGKFSLDLTSQIVEQIGEEYGRWQNTECLDLKAVLLKMEEPGTGRVLLKNFYGDTLKGTWQFTESVPYLQELGALDDSIPDRKSVIIPNYINSRSNCLASSSVYSVCCLNECEALLGHLEEEIKAPEVLPERIASIVEYLPSSTVQAPRILSEALWERLRDVANHHGGRVPLHSRLFAQWMHNVYPRECPYPHTSGTTNPRTPAEWMKENKHTNQSYKATRDEMEIHAANDIPEDIVGTNETATYEGQLMWTMDEELVVVKKPAGWRSLAQLATRLTVLGCVLMAMWQNMGSLFSVFGGGKARKSHMLPFSAKEM